MGFARLEHAGASAPLFSLPFPACGEEGFGKGNFVALSSSAGFGTHYETGPEFLLLFSIKSKEERLCFAMKVLNGRVAYLH